MIRYLGWNRACGIKLGWQHLDAPINGRRIFMFSQRITRFTAKAN